MTYSLMQDSKYIAPLATITGYGEVMEYLKGKDTKFPNLESLFSNGYTNKADKVASEATKCANSAPKDIKKILRDLSKNLKGKSGTVYIGDA